MRRFIMVLGSSVVLFIAVALIAPFFIDLSRYKGEIEQQVLKATGQPITLSGGITLRLLPAPYVKVEDVSFGRTDEGGPIAKIAALSLSADLMPLLQKRLVVRAIDLQKPFIDVSALQRVIEKTQQGASKPKDITAEASPQSEGASKSTKSAFDLHVQSATIHDGEMVIKDGQSKHTLSKFMVKASLGGLQGPLTLDTQGEWDGIPVDVDVAADKLSGDIPVNIRGTFAGARLKLRGQANIDAKTLTGTLNLALPEEMTKVLAGHVGKFSKGINLIGQLDASQKQVILANAEMDMGDVQARGEVNVTLEPKLIVDGHFSNLPGGGALKLSAVPGNGPLMLQVELKANQLGAFVKGLEIKAADLPKELAAGPINLKTSMSMSDGKVHIPNLQLDASGASLKGSVTAKLGTPVVVDFKLSSPTPGALVASAGYTMPGNFAMLSASGTATLADAIKVSADIKADNLSAKVQADIDAKGQHSFTLAVAHPDVAGLLAKFGQSPSAVKGPLLVAAEGAGTATQITLTNLTFAAGALNLKGSAKIDLGGSKPKISADLKGQAFNLDEVLALLEPEEANPYGGHLWYVGRQGVVADKWSRDPLDLKALREVDADIHLSFPSISQAEMVFDQVLAQLSLAGGVLTLQNLQANCYGGSASASMTLDTGRNNALKVSGKIEGAKLRRLIQTEGRFKIKKGVMKAALDVSGAGRSVYDLVASLQGSASINAQDGVLGGMNLKGLSDSLKDLRKASGLLGLVQSAFTKGETRFSKLDAVIAIQSGVATISSFQLDAEGGNGTASGTIDLPRYVMDVGASFQLSELPQYPPVGLRVAGPIDNPQKSVDTTQLEQYILQNVASKVLEKTSIGKKLNKYLPGILPGEQGEGAPDQGQPEKQAPDYAQPQEGAKKKKKHDSNKDIKKHPEKAVEGLLKGLLK